MSMSMTVTSDDLVNLSRVMRSEADGKKLRKKLAADLRKASEPARDAARSSILGMGSAGLPHDGEPLREAIANKIVTEARLSGRSTGAKVKAKRLTQATRGFILAPKRTNAQHWRHKVFGRDEWVEQTGKPNWFDDAMRDNRDEWRQAVVKVMNETAKRIAFRVRTGA